MKRFAKVALLAAMMFGFVASASAGTELKVKGSLDVHGMWSSNLRDFNSDVNDADNYYTNQRFRTYFTYESNKNLKAVLGLEINTDWGQGTGGDWGTDGTSDTRVKHAYLDFVIPETVVNIKAGLQPIALPSVFGNPVFEDDAAALVISAPITDMFGITVGYTRGYDANDNYDSTASEVNDNLDLFFLAAPIKLDGFAVTPYAAYANVGDAAAPTSGQQALSSAVRSNLVAYDNANIWVLGANAKMTLLDPFTVAADLIYGQGKNDDYTTKGWYGALAASYKFDMLTATLFGTYATGADEETDKDNYLPTLAETWTLTPYIGGARAFSTGASNAGFATGTLGDGIDGTGIWTVGMKLDKITFVDKLSHSLTLAYARGTSDKDAGRAFDSEDSGIEAYLVNSYMIFENLAAINELGFFAPHFEDRDEDNSYYATIGFQYKF